MYCVYAPGLRVYKIVTSPLNCSMSELEQADILLVFWNF
jgi:hypothetical protein